MEEGKSPERETEQSSKDRAKLEKNDNKIFTDEMAEKVLWRNWLY